MGDVVKVTRIVLGLLEHGQESVAIEFQRAGALGLAQEGR